MVYDGIYLKEKLISLKENLLIKIATVTLNVVHVLLI